MRQAIGQRLTLQPKRQVVSKDTYRHLLQQPLVRRDHPEWTKALVYSIRRLRLFQ
jgi:hypothetical protein